MYRHIHCISIGSICIVWPIFLTSSLLSGSLALITPHDCSVRQAHALSINWRRPVQAVQSLFLDNSRRKDVGLGFTGLFHVSQLYLLHPMAAQFLVFGTECRVFGQFSTLVSHLKIVCWLPHVFFAISYPSIIHWSNPYHWWVKIALLRYSSAARPLKRTTVGQ